MAVRASKGAGGKGFGAKTVAPSKASRTGKKGNAVPDKSLAQQDAKVEAVAHAPPAVEEEPMPTVPDVATPRPAKAAAEPVKAAAEPVKAAAAEPVKATATPVKAATAEPVKATAEPVKATATPVKAATPPAKASPPPSRPTTLLDELTDTSRLGQRGEAYFAAQFALLGLVFVGPETFDSALAAVGWAAVVGAGALAVAAQQALGNNLTPLPEPRPSNTLVTSGVYSLVRHPMYGALVLLALGVAAITDDGTRYVLAGVLAVVLSRKADFEERELIKRHAREYEEYRRSSKKMLPWLW